MPVLILGGLLLSSCSVTKDYSRPEGVSEGIYRTYESQDSATLATLGWQEIFTDTILQNLIQEGIDHNYDLQKASARIGQARANYLQSRSALFPTLSLDGSLTLQSQSGGLSETAQLTAGSSWEIDLWGKLSSAKRASLNALLESEAYQRSVQTQLVADIASYYYTLLAYDARLVVVEQSLETYKEDAATMKILQEGNVVTGAAVVQSEANRYSAEVTLLELKQNIRETENSLCMLLGRVPSAVERSDIFSQSPAIDPALGVPALLLSYRPDVQEAEYALRYYTELVNVAKAYFYPSLLLTAQGGLSSADLTQLFDPSALFANVVGGLASPLFNHRANRQRLEVAQAQVEEYTAAFRQTVLTAGKEVSDALYRYQAAEERIAMRSQQVQYMEKAVDYTRELMQNTSTTNYTDVLTSEQSLLGAQLNTISDQLEKVLALIELYRSLGGGVER